VVRNFYSSSADVLRQGVLEGAWLVFGPLLACASGMLLALVGFVRLDMAVPTALFAVLSLPVLMFYSVWGLFIGLAMICILIRFWLREEWRTDLLAALALLTVVQVLSHTTRVSLVDWLVGVVPIVAFYGGIWLPRVRQLRIMQKMVEESHRRKMALLTGKADPDAGTE
jgi:hypothetical protein